MMIMGLNVRIFPFDPVPDLWRVSNTTVFLTLDELSRLFDGSGTLGYNSEMLARISRWHNEYLARQQGEVASK